MTAPPRSKPVNVATAEGINLAPLRAREPIAVAAADRAPAPPGDPCAAKRRC